MQRSYLGLLALGAALGAAACGQQEYASDGAQGMAMKAMDVAAEAPAADASAAAEATAPATAPSQIAYSYRYGIEAPTERAPELMQRHEAACVAAGPTVCQVMGSHSERYGSDSVSSRLELRAAPVWLTRFRAGLETEADQAGGRIAEAATEAEDLTRTMSDTAARLRALTTLRDRLQALLATRSAPLEQLLATERELARVQGELDATQSAMNDMRTRVAMSHITLSYRSMGQFAPDSAFTPVSRALEGSLTAFMGTLGAIIYALATLLPVILLTSPLLWLAIRHRHRLRIRRRPVPALQPEPPASV